MTQICAKNIRKLVSAKQARESAFLNKQVEKIEHLKTFSNGNSVMKPSSFRFSAIATIISWWVILEQHKSPKLCAKQTPIFWDLLYLCSPHIFKSSITTDAAGYAAVVYTGQCTVHTWKSKCKGIRSLRYSNFEALEVHATHRTSCTVKGTRPTVHCAITHTTHWAHC